MPGSASFHCAILLRPGREKMNDLVVQSQLAHIATHPSAEVLNGPALCEQVTASLNVSIKLLSAFVIL